MAVALLSEAEKIFILHGIQDNLRTDGRGCEDYRYMELETNIVQNTNGSARLRLSNTDVLVGVKAELSDVNLDKPKEGWLEFFVDFSANAAPEFEGRGGEEDAAKISCMLSKAYSNNACLDLEQLCVISNTKCWILYIDILVLECGGNLFDAISLAVKAALHNTRIPITNLISGEKGMEEVELTDDPHNCWRIDIQNMPCIVTVFKIGNHHLVDASLEEESCTHCSLMMGVTVSGSITAVDKNGSGSLDPDSILDMVECGKRVGMKLNRVLHARIDENENLDENKSAEGFLR